MKIDLKNKEEYPLLYLFLYRQIKEKSEGRPFISHANLMEVMRRKLHKIPRELHYVVVAELEELHLIKKLNKSAYEVTGGNIDKILNDHLCII
jgi:hypothetical protein